MAVYHSHFFKYYAENERITRNIAKEVTLNNKKYENVTYNKALNWQMLEIMKIYKTIWKADTTNSVCLRGVRQ